ncbi:MAG: long-chain-acyl-CoA synthetase [Hyphomonadaceae bacterium]|nr:long-chain-acyl-CoA synthetase [Hyphomonadaceae bacterium]
MNLIARLRADLALIDGLSRTLKAYKPAEDDPTLSIGKDIERVVDLFPDRPAIRFEGAEMTYRQFDARANAYAHWAIAQGLKKGDAVALLMSNRPDYVCAWIGLAKIGVIVGLINTNLTGATLAHAINIAEADHVLVSGDLAPALSAVLPSLTRAPKGWVLEGGADGMASLDEALAKQSTARPDKALSAPVTLEDTALYVYTSGTTGAPKAAKMLNRRVLGMMRAFIGGGHATPEDRVYVTLPLYHGTGGLCGVGFALTTGACLIIRRKFSASHFWTEAASERATVFFYIGELCRYLVNMPPSPADRAHRLRLGVGNGLRPEVWAAFQDRFGVRKMLEFYGSTEGNVSLLNFDGKVGAVGRIPKWLEKRLNVRIVRFDVETEQPVRGQDGLCILAGPDEVGEALGEVRTDDPRFRFEGYSGDPKQTDRKVMRDVFAKGDVWFRTGDLMRRDKDGYFYFVDRIGDTFRWKGENVSTNEVADVLSQYPGVKEANVYGVKVGDLDGRAGMAAVILAPGADLDGLYTYVVGALPSYARPLFLRIQPEIETTGTFKYRKVDLAREGFDPAQTEEPIWFDDPVAKRYVRVTPELFARINAGGFKL